MTEFKRRRYPHFNNTDPSIIHVIVNTHNRRQLFGVFHEESISLNGAGQALAAEILAAETRFPGVLFDTVAIMPNHFHAIVMLGTSIEHEANIHLSRVIGNIKLRVKQEWKRGVERSGWPTYQEHLWQKSYRDVFIYNDRQLETVRKYVIDNPEMGWMKKAW